MVCGLSGDVGDSCAGLFIDVRGEVRDIIAGRESPENTLLAPRISKSRVIIADKRLLPAHGLLARLQLIHQAPSLKPHQ